MAILEDDLSSAQKQKEQESKNAKILTEIKIYKTLYIEYSMNLLQYEQQNHLTRGYLSAWLLNVSLEVTEI